MTSEGPDWLVLREGREPRWGGEIRRHHIFKRLAERTGAVILEDGWSDRGIRRATLGALGGRLPAIVGRRFQRPSRPLLAASEKLRESTLASARALTVPAVVAVYDDQVAQAAAIGVRLDPDWRDRVTARQRANVQAVPLAGRSDGILCRLAGLDPDRVIVGGNGTNTSAVRPGPWPTEPAVGIVSGAAPGRGLELLVEATSLARGSVPGLKLLLWLVAPDDQARTYLDGLMASVAGDPWRGHPNRSLQSLGTELAEATALAIAHPSNDYMDVALPVKLFDSMAAGRPLVVTPRLETRAIVEEFGVGVVAGGDAPEDLAAAIVELLSNEARAQRERGEGAEGRRNHVRLADRGRSDCRRSASAGGCGPGLTARSGAPGHSAATELVRRATGGRPARQWPPPASTRPRAAR